MNRFVKQILKEGRVLPGDVLKIDSFFNHQVDIKLMRWIGKEFYKRFKDAGVTKIMTLEASGIPPAVMTAHYFGLPLVFVKKAKSSNLGNQNLYRAKIKSYTYGFDYYATCVKDFISKDDKILIIDDFLATGEAIFGMINICKQAKAKVVGVGACVEKGFQPGGKKIRKKGYRLESLAIISKMDDDGYIEFVNK